MLDRWLILFSYFEPEETLSRSKLLLNYPIIDRLVPICIMCLFLLRPSKNHLVSLITTLIPHFPKDP